MKEFNVFGSTYYVDFNGDMLPCPMCGNKDLWIGAVDGETMDTVGVVVECQNCGLRTKAVDKGSYNEDALIAINLWNKRV